jgi:hypothetical protein
VATNYSRGRAREYRTMALLEAAGFEAYRMAGSHGPFDVIGISNAGIVLVQCKLNGMPKAWEIEQMKGAQCPCNGRKLLHAYEPGRRMPAVIEVEGL